ncbi:MAG TPA: hypothetical protein VIG36_07470 [Methylocystis sp.]
MREGVEVGLDIGETPRPGSGSCGVEEAPNGVGIEIVDEREVFASNAQAASSFEFQRRRVKKAQRVRHVVEFELVVGEDVGAAALEWRERLVERALQGRELDRDNYVGESVHNASI